MTDANGKRPHAAPTIEVRVPDLGEFTDVAIIDVLVKVGDAVEPETPLLTLESDKATMDVPSPAAGVVARIAVKAGDKVNTGTMIMELSGARQADAEDMTATRPNLRETEPYGGEPYVDTVPIEPLRAERLPAAATNASATKPAAAVEPARPATATARYDYDVVVIGAGPGGYTAAFRAADLGLKVALVERWPTLGGVCLNVGCIPSKALLHAAKVIEDARAMASCGVEFGPPRIDASRLREWKDKVVGRLTGGLSTMARQRKVTVLRGTAAFTDDHSLVVTGVPDRGEVTFAHCIIAVGSESMRLPGLPDDPRIIDSTGALELDLPARMLVDRRRHHRARDGDGLRGAGRQGQRRRAHRRADAGLRPRPREAAREAHCAALRTHHARHAGSRRSRRRRRACARHSRASRRPGRRSSTRCWWPSAARRTATGSAARPPASSVDERGFIPVDRQMRTNVPHIFAIGDVAGQPMLAHKATHEAKVAAEVAAGHKRHFDARAIPSVAYTDPEIAWVGLTETEAKARNVAFEKAVFPWAASGRSLAIGREEGFTKLLFDPETHRVIGGGIVGTNAGDLIAEVVLAIEMGADASDIGLTIHPHPTLSETVAFAAEAFDGTLTDLYLPKKRGARKPGG